MKIWHGVGISCAIVAIYAYTIVHNRFYFRSAPQQSNKLGVGQTWVWESKDSSEKYIVEYTILSVADNEVTYSYHYLTPTGVPDGVRTESLWFFLQTANRIQ